MFPKIILTCCSDMTAKKITYARTGWTSLWRACKHSTHFLFLKKIYIVTDDTGQFLLCSSSKGP